MPAIVWTGGSLSLVSKNSYTQTDENVFHKPKFKVLKGLRESSVLSFILVHQREILSTLKVKW